MPNDAIPSTWMPNAIVKRIIWHWTAGSHTPSELEKEHYHLLVAGNGELYQGKHPISSIMPPLREGAYAAHTRKANSYSIGCAVCCMQGAIESPFDPGRYPITHEQWLAMVHISAVLCRRYDLEITPVTLLTHAEVTSALNIPQRGKWDITVLPDPNPGVPPTKVSAFQVGTLLRAATQRLYRMLSL